MRANFASDGHEPDPASVERTHDGSDGVESDCTNDNVRTPSVAKSSASRVMATNDELRRRMSTPRVVASVVGIASAGGKLAVRAASVQWRASPDESQFNVCDDLAPR
jgi:hypothetical protein